METFRTGKPPIIAEEKLCTFDPLHKNEDYATEGKGWSIRRNTATCLGKIFNLG